MDRSSFLKRAAAAIAGIVVGSKLDAVVPVEKTELLPGKGHEAFTIYFEKDWFRQHDIVSTPSGEYYVAKVEGDFVTLQRLTDGKTITVKIVDFEAMEPLVIGSSAAES